MRNFRSITVRLLNYRADGTPFVNDLTVMPIVDRGTNTTSHFLGVLRERPLPEPSRPLPFVANSETTQQPLALTNGSAPEPTALVAHGSPSREPTCPRAKS